jgi:hypothetical protein
MAAALSPWMSEVRSAPFLMIHEIWVRNKPCTALKFESCLLSQHNLADPDQYSSTNPTGFLVIVTVAAIFLLKSYYYRYQWVLLMCAGHVLCGDGNVQSSQQAQETDIITCDQAAQMFYLLYDGFFILFYFDGTGFELRASHLQSRNSQSRCSTLWATPPSILL